MSDTAKRHARGRIAVASYEPKAFDEVPGGPTLSDIHVTETFSGDIEGEGVVHFVQAALKRLGHVDEIANVVAFLAGDEARWITGRNIRVNGGTV